MDKVAQQWLERIESFQVSDEDRENFARWYRVPENQKAFDKAKEDADELKDMLQTISTRPAIASLRRRVLDETAVSEGSRRLKSTYGRTFTTTIVAWRRWLISGGFAVAAAVFFFAFFLPQQRNTYTTEVGEQRIVMLNDGSKVTLDTDTQMRVRYGDTERHIHLYRGQAYFEVAKDAERPFSVASDHGIVTAVGTAFAVFQSSEKLIVTLTEGKVQVATPAATLQNGASVGTQRSMGRIVSLTPGEQLSYDPQHGAKKEVLADVNSQMSWLSGKLIFKSAPLAEVVSTLNRYSDNPIVVREQTLLETKVDAIFSTDDIKTSVLALRTMFELDAFYDESGNIELRAKK